MSMDFIPQANDAFFRWQGDFYDRVNEKLSSFKIDAAKLKDVTAAKSKYEQAYHRASNPESANRADRVERDERTADYRAAIRQFVNENIRHNSSVSDYDRQYLGLVIPDRTLTPAPVPLTYPDLTVDFSKPRQHTVHVKDEEKAGKGKPAGVKECEIWYEVSDTEPVRQSAMRYAGSTASGKLLLEFELEERGKKVWYCGRWLNTRGQHGPWGEFIAAFIA